MHMPTVPFLSLHKWTLITVIISCTQVILFDLFELLFAHVSISCSTVFFYLLKK